MSRTEKPAAEQLRLECLKLAEGDVERARMAFHYVVGTTEQERLLRLWDAFKAAIAYSPYYKGKTPSLIYSIEAVVSDAFKAEGLKMPYSRMAFHDYAAAERVAAEAAKNETDVAIGGMIGSINSGSMLIGSIAPVPALVGDEPGELGFYAGA